KSHKLIPIMLCTTAVRASSLTPLPLTRTEPCCFLKDDKVFSYYNHTLEKGFPQEIQQVFPGVLGDLDAAVECPEGECRTDSVLFFK
ncbi:hemopexin, partial [Clarias magur]